MTRPLIVPQEISILLLLSFQERLWILPIDTANEEVTIQQRIIPVKKALAMEIFLVIM
jgi:hypothetical protein